MQLLAMKNNNNLKSKREDAAQNAHHQHSHEMRPNWYQPEIKTDAIYTSDRRLWVVLCYDIRMNLVFYYTVNILSLALHYVHVICEENAKNAKRSFELSVSEEVNLSAS
uniref:Uncharacterized protein n=1 Tax=Glossina palpalis gambiensis TaxID=67801 RepID=A0A1B0C210_9MUSC